MIPSMKIVVGLGNPGEEHIKTRHNAGRIMVEHIEKKLEDQKIKFIKPDTYMNRSGKAVAPFIKSKKDLANLQWINHFRIWKLLPFLLPCCNFKL